MKKIIVIALAVGCFINNNAMLSRFGRQSKVIEAGQKKIERTKSPKKDVIRMYSAGQQDKKSSGKHDRRFQKEYREYTTGVKQESKWNMPGWKALAAGLTGIMAWWYATSEQWEDGSGNLLTTKWSLAEEFDSGYVQYFNFKRNKDKTAYKILNINKGDGYLLSVPLNRYVAIVSYQGDKDNRYRRDNNLIVIPFSFEEKDKAIELMQKYYNSHYSTYDKQMYIISGSNAQPLESEKEEYIQFYQVDNSKEPIRFEVADGLIDYSSLKNVINPKEKKDSWMPSFFRR